MVRFKITNLKEFEATFTSSVKALSAGAVKAMEVEAVKHFKGIAKKVEKSTEYKKLMNDQDLRGILGMPAPGKGFGSDTDGPDLLRILSKFKVRRADIKGGKHRRFVIRFPSMQELEQTLTRNLSRLESGIPKPSNRASWFRWWEFGDRGEMVGQTVLKSNLASFARKRSKKTKGKRDLLKIIREKSRSGYGIQLTKNVRGSTGLQGARLVTRIYADFATKFRGHMQKAVRAYVGKVNKSKQFSANISIR